MIAPALQGLARLSRIDRVVIHHSGTPRSATFAALESGHRKKGYLAIGYHMLVMGDGTLHPGRPLPLEGAHAPPWNRSSVGLCIVGNNMEPEHAWTWDQTCAARAWIDALELAIGQPLELYGHRNVGHPTDCPGMEREPLLALFGRLK